MINQGILYHLYFPRFFKLFALIGIIYLTSCTNREEKAALLTEQYCSSCHKYTAPELLPRAVWKNSVLPRMGAFLGIRPDSYNPFQDVSYREQTILMEQRVYPSSPLISQEDWKTIESFILAHAPDSLPSSNQKTLKNTTDLFSFESRPLKEEKPMVTMVKYEAANTSVYTSYQDGQLSIWDLKTDSTSTLKFNSPVIDVDQWEGEATYSLIGYMHPSELDFGSLLKLDQSHNTLTVLLKELSRPVQTEIGDLNGDHLEDIVVSTFGNLTGEYAWFEQLSNGEFEEHPLLKRPGAIVSEVIDFDSDGDQDIVTLFAQGDESVLVFTNDGKGQFTTNLILRFPAVYGSNSMKVLDFNADGHLDLVITHGDNADLSQVLKPYHGIRIFINDGKNAFSERFFFPMNGASKAEVADFDLDGDLDIFCIAHFSDFLNKDHQSLLFLENMGEFQFEASAIPEAQEGHWLVSDIADLDADGDMDILLGSNLFSLSQESVQVRSLWESRNHSVVILRNKTKP